MDSLIALQKPGGGWAASTQRGIGRPEVTAWILDAMVRNGLAPSVQRELTDMLERMVAVPDAVAWSRTTVVAVVAGTLCDVAPDSPRLPDLIKLLVDGAGLEQDGGQASASWGENLFGQDKRSVPHTALAVGALQKATRVRPNDTGISATAQAGITWLSRPGVSLAQTDEQLRRPVADGQVDALFIGHFTAALVAQVLLKSPEPERHRESLRRAMREVVSSQHDGIWRWHDGSRPIWMTYQGAAVLSDYALRNMAWPP